jgi:hypothetical protein
VRGEVFVKPKWLLPLSLVPHRRFGGRLVCIWEGTGATGLSGLRLAKSALDLWRMSPGCTDKASTVRLIAVLFGLACGHVRGHQKVPTALGAGNRAENGVEELVQAYLGCLDEACRPGQVRSPLISMRYGFGQGR